jgi:hypothetical protein
MTEVDRAIDRRIPLHDSISAGVSRSISSLLWPSFMAFSKFLNSVNDPPYSGDEEATHLESLHKIVSLFAQTRHIVTCISITVVICDYPLAHGKSQGYDSRRTRSETELGHRRDTLYGKRLKAAWAEVGGMRPGSRQLQ